MCTLYNGESLKNFKEMQRCIKIIEFLFRYLSQPILVSTQTYKNLRNAILKTKQKHKLSGQTKHQ